MKSKRLHYILLAIVIILGIVLFLTDAATFDKLVPTDPKGVSPVSAELENRLTTQIANEVAELELLRMRLANDIDFDTNSEDFIEYQSSKESIDSLLYVFTSVLEKDDRILLEETGASLELNNYSALFKEALNQKIRVLLDNSVLLESISPQLASEIRSIGYPIMLPPSANEEDFITASSNYYYSVVLDSAILEISGYKLEENDSFLLADPEFKVAVGEYGINLYSVNYGTSIELELLCESDKDDRCKKEDYIISLYNNLIYYIPFENNIYTTQKNGLLE